MQGNRLGKALLIQVSQERAECGSDRSREEGRLGLEGDGFSAVAVAESKPLSGPDPTLGQHGPAPEKLQAQV